MNHETENPVFPEHTQPERLHKRHWQLTSICSLAILLLVAVATLAGMKRATSAASTRALIAHPAASNPSCAQPASSWTPTGRQWRLLVTFLAGPRQGQTEVSLMTFACDGTLTASFPGATPADPPALPPTSDGQWEMTSPRAFHYQFRESLGQGATAMVIQVTVNALLTSPTTYVAGGIGIAYGTKSNQPLPGQYNVSQTIARVTDAPSSVQTPETAEQGANVALASLSLEDEASH